MILSSRPGDIEIVQFGNTKSLTGLARRFSCVGRSIIVWAILATASSPAEETGEHWHLLPEPKFMAPEIAWPVSGSRSTILLPVRGSEPSPLTLKGTADPNLSVSEIWKEAARSATRLLDTLPVEYVRNSRKVILYAVITSPDPLTASSVLAPDFAERFLETIGPDVLVAIPNRFTVYVFPRSATPVEELSERIFVDYRSTNYPVSREIFEPRGGRLRAVGELR
ncbi:MAG: hypothetical protein Fur0032_19160 [Terrimicrobiaceae bacterium]